jgi:hypothetical protein
MVPTAIHGRGHQLVYIGLPPLSLADLVLDLVLGEGWEGHTHRSHSELDEGENIELESDGLFPPSRQ